MHTELDSPASVDEVWEALTDFDGGGYRAGTWSEHLRVYGGRGVLGEVRETGDWTYAPANVPLRVVGMAENDRIVIRWLRPDKDASHTKAGVTFHADMVRQGDDGKPVRSGWVEIRSSGKTIVSSG